tara:strand:+ start:7411 stop:8727 length:1317 start_codon:yes stop_codon:yes gene_type:complete
VKLDLDFFEKVFVFKALTDEKFTASTHDFYVSEYIHDTDFRTVMDHMHSYYKEKGKIASLTELRQHIVTDTEKLAFKRVLLELKEFDKEFDDSALYKNTERFLKERAIYKTMLDVAEDISENRIETGDILDRFENSCNISIEADLGISLYNDYTSVIKQLKEEAGNTVASPWEWLDELLNGGFQEKGRALYIAAGETNVGKSIILGNIASHITEMGKTVLLISLEMSELMYAKRMYSNITKIPINEIEDNGPTLCHMMKGKEPNGGQLIIKEFPPSTITPDQLKGFIAKVQQKVGRIDAVVVDYINLLSATDGTNSYERIKYNTEKLRAMSYIYECPFITATQLNRSGFASNNPGLETISESIGLAATADVIWSIWQEESDREVGLVRMSMLKNRFGANFGTAAFAVDYDTLTVEETDIDLLDEDESEIGTLRDLIND